MLNNANIKAFVPTTKPAEAKLFYKNILGLKLLSEDDYALNLRQMASCCVLALCLN
jgi:hypothetical protein